MEKQRITSSADSEVTRHFKPLNEKIEKFLSAEKPADVLIVKSHLICEYYLNQILILKDLCSAREIDKLDFFEKANKALDLNDVNQKNIYDRLLRLNKLRNKIGHELEYELSESDVDGLGYYLGKSYVIDKYEYSNLKKLLLRVLIVIVIDVSLLVLDLISEIKKKQETKNNLT